MTGSDRKRSRRAIVNRASGSCAIIQSNYIPWKGYFDIINSVDVFVLYDTAQYTVNDWRNRNKIKAHSGPTWLTIPVRRESLSQRILETTCVDQHWRRKHWRTISESYAKAAYFPTYRDLFEDLYLGRSENSLSQINFAFLAAVCSALGIRTRILWSHDLELPEGRVERLVAICKRVGASRYISGPAARAYIGEPPTAFEDAGIEVEYFDYSGYPEYRQLFPPFRHDVSALDLLFNEGPEAPQFMKSFGESR